MAKPAGPSKGGNIGKTPIPPGYHQPKAPGKGGFTNHPGKHPGMMKPYKGK